MNSYRNAEIEYRERCKARIQRQIEISETSSYCVVEIFCYFRLVNVDFVSCS